MNVWCAIYIFLAIVTSDHPGVSFGFMFMAWFFSDGDK